MKHTYINHNVKHQPNQAPHICPLGQDGAKLMINYPRMWGIDEVLTPSDRRQRIDNWLNRKLRRAARMNGL